MGKNKANPRYHVVSIRVTDAEKALLDSLTKRGRTSISSLMRVAMNNYMSLPAGEKSH